MTSDSTIKLRVDRLQNDTESIYDMVGGFRAEFKVFRTETRGQFNRIDETLTETRGQISRIDETLTETRGQINRIDETLTETRGQINRIEETLTEVVRRLPEPS